MRTVICGVDHSPAASAVVSTGARLAHDAGARLVLAHVRPSHAGALATPLAHGPVPLRAAPGPEQETEILEHLLADAGHVPGSTRVLEGHPSGALCRLAREEAADLLVVGTRGLGAVGRALFGSVSSDVVRHAPCPAVVVPPDGADADRSIRLGTTIVAGVSSPEDRSVADMAASLAGELGLKLRLAHVLVPVISVLPPPVPGLPPLGARTVDDRTRHREGARLLYEVLDDILSADPSLMVDAEVRIAAGETAAAGLAALAVREDAAALVVGACGRGPLREVLGASTTAELVRAAPIPVVVCRDGQR